MKKALKLLLMATLVVSLFALAGCGCGKSGNVASGVTVMGVDVGGMTRDEVVTALNGVTLNGEDSVTVIAEGVTFNVKASEVGAVFNIEKTADAIVEQSKKNQPFAMVVDIDSALLDAVITQNVGDKETHVVETTARVTETGIEVTNGISGIQVDRVQAAELIGGQFGLIEKSSVTLSIVELAPQAVDYNSFFAGFEGEFKEPEYVMADDGTITVTDSSYGVTLDKASAQSIMEAHTTEGEVYVIECDVTLPNHTKEELENALFRDTMSTYTTSFATSSENRSSNIKLASDTINGIILMPGDEFSFNDALGERTTARGYKTAGAYANGQTVQAVGGGICQVSSTLYNSALLANLEIVTRRSHQMTVSYVPMGRDATVNWGTQDFVFKNNTDYPVKIVSGVANKKITIDIVGTLEDPNMKVEIVTSTVSVLSPSEEYVYDETKDTSYVNYKYGSNGYVVDATRVVYSGTVEVSRQELTRSRYNPTKTIVTVGTKQPEVSTEPSGTDDTQMPPGLMPDTAVTPETPVAPVETGTGM